jgi:hypothetical protein
MTGTFCCNKTFSLRIIREIFFLTFSLAKIFEKDKNVLENKFRENSSKFTKFRILAKMETGIFVPILQGPYKKDPIMKIQTYAELPLSAF